MGPSTLWGVCPAEAAAQKHRGKARGAKAGGGHTFCRSCIFSGLLKMAFSPCISAFLMAKMGSSRIFRSGPGRDGGGRWEVTRDHA